MGSDYDKLFCEALAQTMLVVSICTLIFLGGYTAIGVGVMLLRYSGGRF